MKEAAIVSNRYGATMWFHSKSGYQTAVEPKRCLLTLSFRASRTEGGVRMWVKLVSIDSIHQFLTGVFQISVSTGTIQNWISQLADATATAAEEIRKKVSECLVLHCDETELSINGSPKWMHCVCDWDVSNFSLHDKRSAKAMDEKAILPEYRNIVLHDFWKSNFKYDKATHGICNAHLLRELIYEDEQLKQSWAKSMHDLLLEILHRQQVLKKQSETCFPEKVCGVSRTAMTH